MSREIFLEKMPERRHRCAHCKALIPQNSPVYMIGWVHPKEPDFACAYLHQKCFDRQYPQREEYPIPDEKVLAFWRGVVRIISMRRHKKRPAGRRVSRGEANGKAELNHPVHG